MSTTNLCLHLLCRRTGRTHGSVQNSLYFLKQRFSLTHTLHTRTLSLTTPQSNSVRNYSSTNDGDNKKDVLFKSVNSNGLIVINRPEVMNVCSVGVWKSLIEYIGECERSQKMFIIRGQGDKAFCAGGDIRLIKESILAGTGVHKDAFPALYEICNMIGNQVNIPYIALINGIAMGGGLGLALLAQYRIATQNTICAMPETAIGLFPDAGAAYSLPRLRVAGSDKTVGKHLGLFLALTGHRLRGSDNFKVGIATHLCPHDQLDELQDELLSLGRSKRPITEEIEEILQSYTESFPDSSSQFSLEEHSYLENIDKCFEGKSVEEIMENLSNHPSEWSTSILEILRKKSPTSLKITFKHFQMSRRLSHKECLRVDFDLFQRCIQGPDFKEGVRAVLIDKDHRPRWDPPQLKDVSDDYVATFFKALSKESHYRE